MFVSFVSLFLSSFFLLCVCLCVAAAAAAAAVAAVLELLLAPWKIWSSPNTALVLSFVVVAAALAAAVALLLAELRQLLSSLLGFPTKK